MGTEHGPSCLMEEWDRVPIKLTVYVYHNAFYGVPPGGVVLLLTTWFASFLLEGERVVAHRPFPKDPTAIAERLRRVEEWKVLEEERELVKDLPEFFVLEPRLERMGGNMMEGRPPFLDPQEFGYDRGLLHDAMVLVAEARMRRAVGPDDHVIQGVKALEDVVETSNLLTERLRDWYTLHFPELNQLVPEAQFLEMVATHGSKERMPGDFGDSVGAELPEEERRRIIGLATMIQEVRSRQASLEAYLAQRMGELAPNVTRMAGPVVGARLIAHAGGLRELALLPTSTVQLLGAEKALFRHLRTGARPPKHGVLFQHPVVHGAAPWQRGPISRLMAAKVSVAARADAFTGNPIAGDLLRDFEEAVARLKQRRPHPPPRPRGEAKGDKGRRRYDRGRRGGGKGKRCGRSRPGGGPR